MNLRTLFKKIKKLGLRLGFKKLMGYEAIFSCAFRPNGDQGWILLPHSDDYWYADPLIFSREGLEIVFMERVNRHTGIGSIVASDVTDGTWKPEVPVIEEKFHMSFPMIFEWRDELYMIPETEMDRGINLYRCTEFPYAWEHVGRYLDGTRIVDSVVECIADDHVRLLGSDFNEDDDFYTRFHGYGLHADEDGSISATDDGLITREYTLRSRMAGYPLKETGRTVYPVQRSTSGVYGYSVMFMKDHPADGETLSEILPSDVYNQSPAAMPKLIGVHTYSRSDRYEVIDVQYLTRKIKCKNG
mgnify:CR=1 FL=1